ncbi:MAG: YdcF family protein [Eggerthellaceae bacterium]|jgi:vancomycin permeability regulator SanA|nr:YdcF family protein [Eggerthellaceae bacterium]MCH4220986.1 YdcF family protein [Eggerthellaceae bacterium]
MVAGKHIMKGIGIAVLCFVVLALITIAVPNAIECIGSHKRIVSASDAQEQQHDCIIVLGASVYPDGSPSGILQDRLDTAIDLYRAGAAPKIIMSGDDKSDTSYDEVTNMKAYAVEQGVPSEDIFCDHAGLCTYDSMYRAAKVFGAEHPLIVTQTYHLYRAIYDACGQGMDAEGVASDLHSYSRQSYYDIREIGARVSDFIKVHIKAQSHYLSEPVSLDQSGDVTSW